MRIMSRKFWKHFMSAIAAVSAFATILSVLFPIKISQCIAIGIALVIVVTSLVYAMVQTSSKTKVTINVQPQLKLTIKQGDLFVCNGVVLIPVNEYFDTHVGDGVINENSIHGLFINKIFKGREDELDDKIEEALKSYEPLEEKERAWKKRKYKLGTCAKIEENGNIYILFAFTHFDNNNTANIERYEYANVVNDVLKRVAGICENRPVYMPLFRTGLSRINLPAQQVLHYLTDTILFTPPLTILGGLNIVIKSLEDSGVNLNRIEDIFNSNKFLI